MVLLLSTLLCRCSGTLVLDLTALLIHKKQQVYITNTRHHVVGARASLCAHTPSKYVAAKLSNKTTVGVTQAQPYALAMGLLNAKTLGPTEIARA